MGEGSLEERFNRLGTVALRNPQFAGAQPLMRIVEDIVLDQHSHPVAHAAVQLENRGNAELLFWRHRTILFSWNVHSDSSYDSRNIWSNETA